MKEYIEAMIAELEKQQEQCKATYQQLSGALDVARQILGKINEDSDNPLPDQEK